jgi:hypothetical protein
MTNKNKKPLFVIRKIANKNPRLIKIYNNKKEKIWRTVMIFFLALCGIASLLVFGDHSENKNLNNKIQTQFLEASVQNDWDSINREIEYSPQSDWDGINTEIENQNSVSTQNDWDGINAEILEQEKEYNKFLGKGFEKHGGFSGEISNPTLENKSDDKFKTGGVGIVNALIYNINDYFKYLAGSVAILYMIIATTQIVTATSDDNINKGKDNLKWSIVGLIIIFAINVIVTAFFEAGATPGESLFTVSDGVIEDTGLLSKIAEYFKINARIIFDYIKVLSGALAILFIFMAGAHTLSAAGSDEKIEKEKKYLMHAITAFATLLMLDTLIFGFIYPDNKLGESDPICTEFINFTDSERLDIPALSMEELETLGKKYGISPATAAGRIGNCSTAAELGAFGTKEISGIINFFTSLIGGIAIFFIVNSGVTIISAFGNEDIVNKHKKTLLWSGAGLAVIIMSNVIVNEFIFVVDTTTGVANVKIENGLTILASITNFITTFIGIFSVISIIIAGIIWVANFGNTEVADKSKKIILGAIMGVILSIVAYSVVNSLTIGSGESSGDGNGVSVNIQK